MAPTRGEAVLWVPPLPVPATLGSDALRDEAQIVRFLEARPEKLDVDAMGDPGLARATVDVLLRADRAFLAEDLLARAVTRWPEDAELRRAWGRVLLSLGRPDAALGELQRASVALPNDAAAQYLLAKAWLAREPRTPESTASASEALRRVLVLAPDYQDSDGVTADVIRDLLDRLAGKRAP